MLIELTATVNEKEEFSGLSASNCTPPLRSLNTPSASVPAKLMEYPSAIFHSNEFAR